MTGMCFEVSLRTDWWLNRGEIKKTQVHCLSEETECGQVHRGQSRWCLQDLHNLSLTQPHTGDIIAACQVCSWWPAVWHGVWALCVYPVLPLCKRGPLFNGFCCQLGTESQDGTVQSLSPQLSLFVQTPKKGQTSRLKSRLDGDGGFVLVELYRPETKMWFRLLSRSVSWLMFSSLLSVYELMRRRKQLKWWHMIKNTALCT